MDSILDILDMLSVIGALLILYVAVPCAALHRKFSGLSYGQRLFRCAVAGLCLQSLLGFLWSQLGIRPVWTETAAYLVLWGAVWTIRPRQQGAVDILRAPRWEGVWMAAILIAGFVLRSIHPLETAALGQSDAYSHLQFLRDILSVGRLRHALYPPGFHWVLALPATCFGLDPYVVARYAGGFFGVLLVAGVYDLSRSVSGPLHGIAAAALVSFFPAFLPLIKTGVGAFANQLGLLMVPAALLAYRSATATRSLVGVSALCAVMTALAVAVPMMLIDLLLVMGIHWALSMRASAPTPHWKHWMPIGALAVAGGLLLLHVISAGSPHLIATARILCGTDAIASSGAALAALARDFFTVKRIGFPLWIMNAACLALGVAFLGIGITGLRKRDALPGIIGVWGVVSSLQTGFGLLQFSAYQRAGWTLMIATACLGGWIVSRMDNIAGLRRILRIALVAAVPFSCAVAFAHYPRHAPVLSVAEGDLVSIGRQVSRQAMRDAGLRPPRTFHKPDAALPGMQLDPRLPAAIVARRFSGFEGNQGDPLRAALDAATPLRDVAVDPDTLIPIVLDDGTQYVVFLDELPTTTASGMFSSVSPQLPAQLVERREILHRANRRIRRMLDTLPRERWSVSIWQRPGLEIVLLVPTGQGAQAKNTRKK